MDDQIPFIELRQELTAQKRNRDECSREKERRNAEDGCRMAKYRIQQTAVMTLEESRRASVFGPCCHSRKQEIAEGRSYRERDKQRRKNRDDVGITQGREDSTR